MVCLLLFCMLLFVTNCLIWTSGFIEPYFSVNHEDKSSVVRFLSEKDGRKHMMRVSKEILRDRRDARKSKNGSNVNRKCDSSVDYNQLSPVRIEDVSAKMSRDYDFPDPELIIRLGSTASLFGFNPWQSRLSEIIFLNDDFLSYSNKKHVTSSNTNTIIPKSTSSKSSSASLLSQDAISCQKHHQHQQKSNQHHREKSKKTTMTYQKSRDDGGLNTLTEFYSVLVKFSKCNQRFGK